MKHLSRLNAGVTLMILVISGSGCEQKSVPLSSVVYEGFNYQEAVELQGLDGGKGFIRRWQFGIRGSQATDARPMITKESLTYPGLKTTGGACRIPVAGSMLVSTRELAPELTEHVDGNSRYLGFLMRPEGTLGDGALNGYFVVGLLGTKGSVFAGRPGGDRMDRYVIENSGGANQVASDVPPRLGQTAFLVLKVEFNPGDDRITLFVNPKIGTGEPKVGVTKTDTDLGEVQSVMLYSTGAHSLDEIRFGRTFQDVTPAKYP